MQLQQQNPATRSAAGRDLERLTQGRRGNDWIFGGSDEDTLLGGEGHDNLFGRRGDDVLFGGVGADNLVGDAGDDMLFGGHRPDRISRRTRFGHGDLGRRGGRRAGEPR